MFYKNVLPKNLLFFCISLNYRTIIKKKKVNTTENKINIKEWKMEKNYESPLYEI